VNTGITYSEAIRGSSSNTLPSPLNQMSTFEHNYLFPEPEPLAKGRLTELPLDSAKNLEPIEKTENDDKLKADTPAADKEFFSFFTLSNYNIPIEIQKASIELSENIEK
jgi:hypothetical protein